MQTQDRTSRDRYFDLVKAFPLRPIRNRDEHQQAMAVYRKLMFRDEPLTEDERDYIDLLLLSVKDFERREQRIDTGRHEPLDLLKHLMAEHQMDESGLARLIGSEADAAQILSGTREMSKDDIRSLSRFFSVDASLFL